MSLACAEVGDYDGFRDADQKFHRLVAQCSGNQLLAIAISDTLLLTSALRQRDVPDAGHPVRCGEQHVRVAEAIRMGEAEAAARQMTEHIEHVMSAVLHAVTEQVVGTAVTTTTPRKAADATR